jgi:two-component system, OmpR family, alkaline phosphatase synthesis response regulator PhoP
VPVDHTATILMVEDDSMVRYLVAEYFRRVGYEVIEATDGEMGLKSGLEKRADVIILDVMMPKMNGFDVCQQLRQHQVTTPIIFLTSKSEEHYTVAGLEGGGDDFLPKPFSPRELEARVKSVIRRSGVRVADKPVAGRVVRGGLAIDPEAYSVLRDDEPVSVTPIEFKILELLMSNPGKAFSREALLDQVWGTSYEGYERNIDPHVMRLRSKVEPDPSKPTYILTVWGVGYKFNDKV